VSGLEAPALDGGGDLLLDLFEGGHRRFGVEVHELFGVYLRHDSIVSEIVLIDPGAGSGKNDVPEDGVSVPFIVAGATAAVTAPPDELTELIDLIEWIDLVNNDGIEH
jgi:hypothetical protein